MKRSVGLAAALLLVASTFLAGAALGMPQGDSDREGIVWHRDLAKARALVKVSGRPILLTFR